MLAANTVKESSFFKNNGLPDEHQNNVFYICIFKHLLIVKLALENIAQCQYISTCLPLLTYIKAMLFFPKNRDILMTTLLPMWTGAMLKM